MTPDRSSPGEPAKEKPSRPASIYFLMGGLGFLGVSGCIGGLALLVDPTGGLLMLPEGLLTRLPIPNYASIGGFILVVFGFVPLLLFWTTWKTPTTGVLLGASGLGLVLVTWIVVQWIFLGYLSVLQPLFFVLGSVLFLLPLVPSVRQAFFELSLNGVDQNSSP